MKDKKTITLIFFLIVLLIVIREPPHILASQVNSNAGISFTEKADSENEEDADEEGIVIDNETSPAVISNGTISKLPQTGGQKNSMFFVVGLILVAISMQITNHLKKKVTYNE